MQRSPSFLFMLAAAVMAVAAGTAIMQSPSAFAADAPSASKAASKVFELPLTNGAVAAQNATLKVTQGDNVELRWTSDRPINLHMHGYDFMATVTPQKPAVMAFNAKLPGRFPVSEHSHDEKKHHQVILYIEVHP
ncbi:MAG: hypothetical protein JWP52_2181 [Rhizobacter sp.]|nr:hypothetical protein [Rhizobacter sp.]